MKKKIFLLLILVFLLFFCVVILNKFKKENDKIKISDEDGIKIVYDFEKNNRYASEKNISDEINVKNNVDKSRFTIVIDPGHSSTGNSETEPMYPGSGTMKAKDVLGASGVVTGTPEYQITFSVAEKLKDKLENMGYNIVMTKQSVDESISNIERAEIGNNVDAKLVVRIHADSAESSSVSGASVLVPAENEHTTRIYDESLRYGKIIINRYTEELGINNRGVVYRDDLTGFNWSKVPVVLIEMGFLSNENEDRFLSDESNHDRIADVLANGIDSSMNSVH